jgi:spore coat polysaccharide biosynthesis protein SpsF
LRIKSLELKTVAIIQARLGSTRLPYKMMLSLHGKPIIEWVVRRVQKAQLLDDIIVAIPISEDNDILAKYVTKLGIKVYRGSESNVLNRFYEATKDEDATHIVRICADNPLIDSNEIDNLIKFYKENRCDYAYNHIPKGNLYPDGLGAEIISFDLLKHMSDIVASQHHKEHCLSYIWDNKDQFIIKTFDPPNKELHHPKMKFDVDTFDDYYKLAMKNLDINISSRELIKMFGEENETKRTL